MKLHQFRHPEGETTEGSLFSLKILRFRSGLQPCRIFITLYITYYFSIYDFLYSEGDIPICFLKIVDMLPWFTKPQSLATS